MLRISVFEEKQEIYTKVPKQSGVPFVFGAYTKNMGTVKKTHLPEKTCTGCGLPFRWRKKWERHWEEVKYCSERCRQGKKTTNHATEELLASRRQPRHRP